MSRFSLAAKWLCFKPSRMDLLDHAASRLKREGLRPIDDVAAAIQKAAPTPEAFLDSLIFLTDKLSSDRSLATHLAGHVFHAAAQNGTGQERALRNWVEKVEAWHKQDPKKAAGYISITVRLLKIEDYETAAASLSNILRPTEASPHAPLATPQISGQLATAGAPKNAI